MSARPPSGQDPAGPRTDKRALRALVRSGVRDDHSPDVARKTRPPANRTICVGCGAVYVRKTWRQSEKRLLEAAGNSARLGLCPACRQTTSGPAIGRVRLEGSYVARHETEILRRIENVAARAAYTQPERRILDVIGSGSPLEVLTTSQKLAHRIARELVKAFRGTVSYQWSDDDGRLAATWRRDDDDERR